MVHPLNNPGDSDCEGVYSCGLVMVYGTVDLKIGHDLITWALEAQSFLWLGAEVESERLEVGKVQCEESSLFLRCKATWHNSDLGTEISHHLTASKQWAPQSYTCWEVSSVHNLRGCGSQWVFP